MSGDAKKWREGVEDKEVHANSPGKVSDETEVGTCRRVGEPRIRSKSGWCIHSIRFQRGEGGWGEGRRR